MSRRPLPSGALNLSTPQGGPAGRAYARLKKEIAGLRTPDDLRTWREASVEALDLVRSHSRRWAETLGRLLALRTAMITANAAPPDLPRAAGIATADQGEE